MVVRGHQVGEAADTVGHAVIAYIYHKINVIAADRLCDHGFSFSGTKTGSLYSEDVGISLITFKSKGIKLLMISFLSPFYKPVIDLGAKGLTAFQRDQPKSSYRECCEIFGA